MLLALAGCSRIQEDNIDVPEKEVASEGRTLVVNAGIPGETKVTIAEDGSAYKMSWEATGETAKLLERKADWSMNTFDSNSAVVSGEGIAFSFNIGAVEEPDGEQGYDIIYPRSAYISGNSLRATLELPASQTPRAGSPDPAASLLAGRVDGTFATRPASVNATFGHLAAYGRMSLKGLPSSETITSISLATEDIDIAGRLEYNTNSGTISNSSVKEEYTITLAGDNLTADPAGFDVWFACKPFTLSAGKTLTITTVTNVATHTAVLTAAVDVLFQTGKVTELPGFSDTYTVTFDSNGGSAVASKVVRKGYTVSAPADPTKSGSLAEGLYLGDIEDAEQGALFVGWCTDPECTVDYDFSTPVTGDLTLYAKWDTQTPIAHGIAEPDDDTWNAGNDYPYYGLTYVNNQSLASETHYTIVMNSNCTVWNKSVTLNNANAVVRIIGKTSERTISRSNLNAVFNVTAGTLIMGKNLKCTYTGSENNPFFNVNGAGATLIFDDGCTFDGTGKTLPTGKGIIEVDGAGAKFILDGGRITGCTFYSRPVYLRNLDAQFIINDGSIDNNIFNSVLYQSDWAETDARKNQFVMNGGSVSNNTFSNYLIYLKNNYREVQITGGEIKDNTANGGADYIAPVYVTSGRFIMSGGDISGNSVTSTSLSATVAGGVISIGYLNSSSNENYVMIGGSVKDNVAYRTAVGEVTGYRGQQMIGHYPGKVNGNLVPMKKRDENVSAGTNITVNPWDGNFNAWWTDAPNE